MKAVRSLIFSLPRPYIRVFSFAAIVISALLCLSIDSFGETVSQTQSTGAFASSGANCSFFIDRVSSADSNSESVGVNRKLRPFAGSRSRRSQGHSQTFMMVSPGLRGSIDVDGIFADVSCRRTARVMIVEIYSGSKRDGRSVSLSTSLTVSPGQKIDLGGTVRSLRSNDKNFSTATGVRIGNGRQQSQDSITLTVR